MRGSWLVLGLVAGCAHSPDGVTPDPVPYAEAVERARVDLDRLAALEVFEVGDLLVDGAPQAQNCYGPCPVDDVVAAEFVAQSERLHALADVIEAAAARAPAVDACSEADVADALDALRALDVFEVGDLLRVEAESDPQCYNLPCPEEVAAAEAETCARAGQLANIAVALR